MINQLLLLPQSVTDHIFNILWGENNDFKIILKKSLAILPKYWTLHLKSVNKININGKLFIALEDNLYCPICGEKFLFPFTRDICWDCDEPHNPPIHLHNN